MKFPKLTELDEDQKKVYDGAPVDGTILVMGPPGTGKTVIAFHRARVLKGMGQAPKVLMYNKVLKRFSSGGSGESLANDIAVKTLHQWVWGWWFGLTGARGAPSLNGEPYQHDWEAIQGRVIKKIVENGSVGRASWGHLIIDEGQDFQEPMYSALRSIMTIANAKGATPPLAITVMADENQRLNERHNATLDQIRQGLGLHASQKNVFTLRKNYRNTQEIARFASHFYVGLQSGQPDLPSRRHGVKPVISISGKDTEGKNLNAFVEKIAKYAKAHRTMEVGVLTPKDATREKLVNRLSKRLDDEGIIVQTYTSKNKDAPAEDLVFDTPGHVTVLNCASAKGLEFDAVFIVDPGSLMTGGAAERSAKMTLYVMCSRARAFLNVMLVRDDSCKTLLSWLPNSKDSHQVEEL